MRRSIPLVRKSQSDSRKVKWFYFSHVACSISGPRGAFENGTFTGPKFQRGQSSAKLDRGWTSTCVESVLFGQRFIAEFSLSADYFFTDKVYSLKSVEEDFIVLKQELHKKKIWEVNVHSPLFPISFNGGPEKFTCFLPGSRLWWEKNFLWSLMVKIHFWSKFNWLINWH